MKRISFLFIALFISLCMMGKVDAFTCDYKCDDENCEKKGMNLFSFSVDADNKTIDILSTDPDLDYTDIQLSQDPSLNEQWFHKDNPNKDKCQSIYVCTYFHSWADDSGGGSYYRYRFYPDDGEAKDDYVWHILDMPWWEKFLNTTGEEFYKRAKCYYAEYVGDNQSLVPSGTSYKCSTFNNGINSIRSLYTEIGSASKGTDVSSQYKKVNSEVERLQAYCKGVFASFDYNSDCVQDCTHLEGEISAIKVQNGINDASSRTTECGLSERIADWIIKIVSWVRYIIPVLLIVLSILDFMKAIAADSEEDIKKAVSRFIKRLIVSVVIFLLPLLLEFILGIFGVDAKGFCL